MMSSHVAVFQYGSNMSSARLNDPGRPNGQANVQGIARTVRRYKFGFTVWSD